MKRPRLNQLLQITVVFLIFAFTLGAQETGGKTPEKPDMQIWLWANFAILVLGLGYLASKSLPQFFRSRTEDIQRGIAESAKLKAEAEAKAAEIEQRLASIGTEIENLRTQLTAGVAAEGERIRREGEAAANRLREQALQEIAFITKAARQDLKAYSAGLAIELARQRIQNRMDPETEHRLIYGFLLGLHTSDKGGAAQK